MKIYQEIDESRIPSGVRWDVAPSAQGQMVEVAYGTFGAGEAGPGDPYKRVTDRADGSRTYYRRESRRASKVLR